MRSRAFANSLTSEYLADQVRVYAIAELAPAHLDEIRNRREARIDKTHDAVRRRLTREINHWDQQARHFREQEEQGKRNARLNRQLAEQRADRLYERLQRRERELEEERQIAASPPVIVGRALVVPIGLLLDQPHQDLLDRRITEQIAMHVVMQEEISRGHHPTDVSAENRGYDIVSLYVESGRLRFLEVKGRRAGATTVTVTHNEIVRALNTKEQYALVVVEVEEGRGGQPCYIWKPPFREPSAIEVSITFRLEERMRTSSTSSAHGWPAIRSGNRWSSA